MFMLSLSRQYGILQEEEPDGTGGKWSYEPVD